MKRNWPEEKHVAVLFTIMFEGWEEGAAPGVGRQGVVCPHKNFLRHLGHFLGGDVGRNQPFHLGSAYPHDMAEGVGIAADHSPQGLL